MIVEKYLWTMYMYLYFIMAAAYVMHKKNINSILERKNNKLHTGIQNLRLRYVTEWEFRSTCI